MRRISRTIMSYVIHPYRPRLSLQRWRGLMGFSFWLWLSTLANMAWNDFDPFALGRVFGSAGLGLYTLATQVARLPTTELIDPIASVLLASFAYAQRDRQMRRPNPFHVMSAMLLLVTPMALVISARAGDLVALLLGANWSATAPLVVLAAWGSLLYPIHAVGGAVLVARGDVRGKFYITAAGAALRITLVVLAVLTGSLPVVVLATIGALAGGAVCYVFKLKPDLREPGLLAGFLRIAGAAIIAAFLLKMLGLGWQPTMSAMPYNHARNVLALLHLSGAAMVAGGAFGVVALFLWLTAGRPDGAEKLILGVLQQFLPPGGLRALSTRLIAPHRQ